MASIVHELRSLDRTADQSPRNDDRHGNGEIDRETLEPRRRNRASTLPQKRTGSLTRLTRTMTLEIAAREYVWLWEVRHGLQTKAIAAREGVSIGRVRFGVARAGAQEKSAPGQNIPRPPRLIPLFPVGPYTPQSSCGHGQPIRSGSVLCCMVCHRSGIDEHPSLQRDSSTDPAPEPVVPAEATEHATRKQRRQRLFGSQDSR